jgi:hypothetical protein
MESDDEKCDEMLYCAYLVAAIRRGSEEIDRREAIEHEELKRRLAKWLDK